jgi:hypothetical protein
MLFSCPEMVRDFWSAGASILTLLILTGSVVFPFFKQIVLLYAWTVPWPAASAPLIGGPAARSELLRLLHVFGRSAFAAEFFLAYVIQIFYVNVNSGPMHLLVSGDPCPAIYAGLISTALVFLLSHALLEKSDTGERLIELGSASHSLALRSNKLLTEDSTWWCISFVLWAMTLACFVASCLVELVHFETSGLIGELMTIFIPQTNPSASFTMLSLATGLPRSVPDEYWGAVVISAVIILVTIVGSVLFLGSVALKLCVTAPARQDSARVRRWTAMSDHFYAWVALEVVWLCTIGASREMDLIAQWTFAKHLAAPCASAQDLLGVDCVKIVGELKPGTWWLLASAVAGTLLHVVVVHREMRKHQAPSQTTELRNSAA